ncbi:MAG: hypothetical protein HRU15_18130 [Planctomycetes bacterium]|nr:hypothetical protein [Planctomycetota bacterium]
MSEKSKDCNLQIIADVLYGINMRPQELAMYGDKATFSIRYAPMFDDPEAMSQEHFKMLVVESHCQLPPDIELGQSTYRDLELLRCGWQLELHSEEPYPVAEIPEMHEEMELLLGKVALTVNDLAARADIEPPMADDVLQRLLIEYRRKHPLSS